MFQRMTAMVHLQPQLHTSPREQVMHVKEHHAVLCHGAEGVPSTERSEAELAQSHVDLPPRSCVDPRFGRYSFAVSVL